LDLWVQQVDGGDPVQLTKDVGICRNPSFSPDGGRIVVTCGGERGTVSVVPALGGLTRQIGQGEWPGFSPDGSQISFVKPLGSGLAPDTILIAPANGGVPRELKPGRTFITPPVWHPDGKRLVIINVESGKVFDWYLVSADSGTTMPTGAGEQLRRGRFGAGP